MMVWNQASADPIRAAEALIKLEAREARLLGLDMPTKVAITDPDGGIPLEAMRRVLERLDRANEEMADGCYAGTCAPAAGDKRMILGGERRVCQSARKKGLSRPLRGRRTRTQPLPALVAPWTKTG